MLYMLYIFGRKSKKMFEAECSDCKAVYTIEQEHVPECVECLCGCKQFNTKKASLIVAA